MRALAIAFCLMGQPVLADCLILGDFALQVDEDVGLIEEVNGVTVLFEPDGRAPLSLTLFALGAMPDPVDSPGLPETEVLPNGMTLRYRSVVDEAVGSGGADTRLNGWLDSTPALGVSCSAQSEFSNAEWCVPILGGLRPKAEGCGTATD